MECAFIESSSVTNFHYAIYRCQLDELVCRGLSMWLQHASWRKSFCYATNTKFTLASMEKHVNQTRFTVVGLITYIGKPY
jgi:hypothetical protein